MEKGHNWNPTSTVCRHLNRMLCIFVFEVGLVVTMPLGSFDAVQMRSMGPTKFPSSKIRVSRSLAPLVELGVAALTSARHVQLEQLQSIEGGNHARTPLLSAPPYTCPSRRDLAPSAFDLAPSAFDLAPSAFDLAPSAFDLAPSAFDLAPFAFDLAPSVQCAY